jgi:hypothetical protein
MKWKRGVGYDLIEDRRPAPVGGGGDLRGRGPVPPKPARRPSPAVNGAMIGTRRTAVPPAKGGGGGSRKRR